MFEIKAILPSDTDFANQWEQINRLVEDALDSCALEIQAELLEPTTEWNHKVEVKVTKALWRRDIFVEDEIYGYLNNGTEPHEIVAVRARALRFYTGGYVSKTAVGSIGSRPGTEGSDTVFRKRARHPGIMPRAWDTLIQQEWSEGKFQERIQTEIDKVL